MANETQLKYPLIRKKRKMHLLSLRDLAAKIGVSYQALSDYEHGKYPPPSAVFNKLKKMLNLEGTVVDFFGRAPLKVKCTRYMLTERCKIPDCNKQPVCVHLCRKHYSQLCYRRSKAKTSES